MLHQKTFSCHDEYWITFHDFPFGAPTMHSTKLLVATTEDISFKSFGVTTTRYCLSSVQRRLTQPTQTSLKPMIGVKSASRQATARDIHFLVFQLTTPWALIVKKNFEVSRPRQHHAPLLGSCSPILEAFILLGLAYY